MSPFSHCLRLYWHRLLRLGRKTYQFASAVFQTGGGVSVSSAILQAGTLATGFILSALISKYSELSVVVSQITGGANFTAITSLIIPAVSVSNVTYAVSLCGTAAVGGSLSNSVDDTVLQVFPNNCFFA